MPVNSQKKALSPKFISLKQDSIFSTFNHRCFGLQSPICIFSDFGITKFQVKGLISNYSIFKPIRVFCCYRAWEVTIPKINTTILVYSKWRIQPRKVRILRCNPQHNLSSLDSLKVCKFYLALVCNRPYLIADGGNVALHKIDGNVVKLKLQGACGSCPSSVTPMKLGIERRLMEKIPEIVAVEAVPDEETGLELNEENIEKVCEPLRASIHGAPLEDARHLTHRYDRMRQEFEAQAAEVIRRQSKFRDASTESLGKLKNAETRLSELKSSVLVLGKEATDAMLSVEEDQQQITFQKLRTMLAGRC